MLHVVFEWALKVFERALGWPWKTDLKQTKKSTGKVYFKIYPVFPNLLTKNEFHFIFQLKVKILKWKPVLLSNGKEIVNILCK